MNIIGACANQTLRFGVLGCFALLLGTAANAQKSRPDTRRFSESEFVSLATRCAPGASADTLLAIAQTESGLYSNAISINRPRAAARRVGHNDGELALARQPRDRSEAASWLRWLSQHHYTVSIGLMQVNAEIAPHLQVEPEQLLEPCTNIRAGAAILISVYTRIAREIGEGFSALDAALSFYNTGDPISGLRNGYVATVYAHGDRRNLSH